MLHSLNHGAATFDCRREFGERRNASCDKRRGSPFCPIRTQRGCCAREDVSPSDPHPQWVRLFPWNRAHRAVTIYYSWLTASELHTHNITPFVFLFTRWPIVCEKWNRSIVRPKSWATAIFCPATQVLGNAARILAASWLICFGLLSQMSAPTVPRTATRTWSPTTCPRRATPRGPTTPAGRAPWPTSRRGRSSPSSVSPRTHPDPSITQY